MLVTSTRDLIINTGKKNRGEFKKIQLVEIECDVCKKHAIVYYKTYLNQQILYKKTFCRSCRVKEEYKLGKRKINNSNILRWNAESNKKSYEEKYGHEKAVAIKNKIHNTMKGKKIGGSWKDVWKINKWKEKFCQPYSKRYNKDKIKGIKTKQSIHSSGKNNNMYGKPAPQGSGNGWSGWYNDIYFRSIMELSYLHYLITNNIKFSNRPSCCGEYMSYESIEWKGLDDKTMHQGQYVCMVCGNRTDFKLKVISGRPPMRRRDHYITDKNTNEK
jgi:hypothetical protein